MTFTNHIIPFQLGKNQVRGSIVRLETTVSEIIKRHNYPSNIESLLADTLTITACLGSRMKHEGIFTIQAKGSSEVHTLFSDITNNGSLRGYVGLEDGFSKKDLNLNALMGSGHISFTLDQGKYSKRYQGIVALEEKSISKSAELYFNNSEQLETRFSNFNYYSIHKKNREKLMSSGLIMLQKMPIKDDIETEENEQIWENSLNFLKPGGIILLHDCLPSNVFNQAMPRCQYDWNGDVWKAIVEFRTKKNLDIYTCFADQGIGVIFNRENR